MDRAYERGITKKGKVFFKRDMAYKGNIIRKRLNKTDRREYRKVMNKIYSLSEEDIIEKALLIRDFHNKIERKINNY